LSWVEQSPRVDASFKINHGLKDYLSPKIFLDCSFKSMALVWKTVSTTLFLVFVTLYHTMLFLYLTSGYYS